MTSATNTLEIGQWFMSDILIGYMVYGYPDFRSTLLANWLGTSVNDSVLPSLAPSQKLPVKRLKVNRFVP